MGNIHPTAIIADGAQIHQSVKIGPYCIIGAHVQIGEGTELKSHVVIEGHTTIGMHNQIFPFASLGLVPQDLKYKGEFSTLTIGDHNIIRESSTIHIGTEGGGGKTVIGNHNLFMGLSHIGHDCILGDHIVLAHGAILGGHVEIDSYVIVGGGSACHQFVRVGSGAMIGGLTPVIRDVLPYTTTANARGGLSGLNLVGLRRRGFERSQIKALQAGYKALFETEGGTLASRLENITRDYPDSEELKCWKNFIEKSKRGLCMKTEV